MKNFNININYKPTFFKLLFLIVVFYFYFLFTGEVLCDGGLLPINESDYNAAISYNTNSWENHYQNRITLPESYDSNGNPIYYYTYPTTNSTQLGDISPTRNEVLNDNYYYSGGYKIPLDTSKTTFKDRLKNKVKTSIKNHIAKSSDESLRQERIPSEISSKRLYELKKVARAQDSRRALDVAYNKSRISYDKKVRRFD